MVFALPANGQISSLSPAPAARTCVTCPGDVPYLDPSNGYSNPGAMAEASRSSAGAVTTENSAANYGHQTKRILYVMPNFNSISAGSRILPLSPPEKLLDATRESFDYSSFAFAGILAGVGQAQRSYPTFGQGTAGYGRYY
jgi:hypothetical protein